MPDVSIGSLHTGHSFRLRAKRLKSDPQSVHNDGYGPGKNMPQLPRQDAHIVAAIEGVLVTLWSPAKKKSDSPRGPPFSPHTLHPHPSTLWLAR